MGVKMDEKELAMLRRNPGLIIVGSLEWKLLDRWGLTEHPMMDLHEMR